MPRKKQSVAKAIIAKARANSDPRCGPWFSRLTPEQQKIASEARDEFNALPPQSVSKQAFRTALCEHLGIPKPSHSTFYQFLDGRGGK